MWSAPLTVALYLAAVVFLGGMAWRVWRWAATPEPFHIPTTTGQQRSLAGIVESRLESPATRAGAFGRMLLEGLLFRSLLRNTAARRASNPAEPCPDPVFLERKALWLAAIAFHWSALAILVRHLRLFVDPVPGVAALLGSVDGFFEVGTPTWYATDAIVVAALGFLLVRRLRDPLLRYLSQPADYAALALLLAVAGSGVVLRYVARPDLVAVRHFTLGLAALAPVRLPPAGAWLIVHLASASLLVAVLPFTKMTHAAGFWLSPTRNQANDSRRRRHVNPWNAPVPLHGYAEWRDEFRDKLEAAGLAGDGSGRTARDSGSAPGRESPAATRESPAASRESPAASRESPAASREPQAASREPQAASRVEP